MSSALETNGKSRPGFADLPEEERRKKIESLTGTFANLDAFRFPEILSLLSEGIGDPSWRVRKAAVEVFLSFPEPSSRDRALGQALRSEDNAGKRNSAIEIFVRLGRKALPEIEKLSRDQDPEVRKFAMEILGEIGGKDVFPLLVSSLSDPDENSRMAAVEALGKIGTETAVAPLIKSLGSSPGLNFLIFQSLKELGVRGACLPVEPLSPRLEDPTLREVALATLGASRNPEALPVLIRKIREGSSRHKEKALLAISELLNSQSELELSPSDLSAGEIIPLLQSPKDQTRLAAIRIISRVRAPEVLETLFPLFVSGSEEEQRLARAGISRLGAESLASLIRRYPKLKEEERSRVLELLGHFDSGGNSAFDAQREKLIRNTLTAPGLGGKEKIEAALAAGRLGLAGMIPELTHLLDEIESELSAAALSALRLLSERNKAKVVQEVLCRLKDGSECVQRNSIILMGEIQAGEALGEVILALKAESPAVREAAAITLAELQAPAAAENLILSLADEDSRVRVAAARALGQLGQENSLEPLLHALRDEDLWARTSVVEALGRIGRGDARVIAALSQELEKGEGPVAEAAVRALAGSGDKNVRPALLQALRAADPEVIVAAVESLTPFREGEVSRELLLHLLSHPAFNVRLRLVQALKELAIRKDPSISRALQERLEVEEDPLVRETVLALLRGSKGEARFPDQLQL